MLTFNYVAAYPLAHEGDCGLIGVTPARQLYVEEFYGDDLLAQHHLDETGQILQTVDEGTGIILKLLPLPELLARPEMVKTCLPLNYIGARHRGLRESERLSDVVQALPIDEKMALLEHLALRIPPMMLAGIAESRVLSEALLEDAGLYLVCRRILLAVMLPEQRLDSAGQPYDYDTIPLHVAHVYDVAKYPQPQLHKAFDGIGGIKLMRPLECMVHGDRLYLAEGGAPGTRSRVHVWNIEKKGPSTGLSQVDTF